MQIASSTTSEIEYRVVLVLDEGSNALCFVRGDVRRLPRISMPRDVRYVGYIQQHFHDVYGLEVFVVEIFPEVGLRRGYVVAEILNPVCDCVLESISLTEFSDDELNLNERSTLESIVNGRTQGWGLLSRIEWRLEMQDWVARSTGREVTAATLRQHNAGGGFALIQFTAKSGERFWLKATGWPNMAEFEITRILTAIRPDLLPACIAMRKEWNAWLMEDAGHPMSSQTLHLLPQAISSMATIQQSSMDHTAELLAAGALDQRIETLYPQIDDVFEYLAEIMALQTATHVPILDVGTLHELQSAVSHACTQLMALRISDTVVHNDINLGNILVREDRCSFSDWSEAGVSNPFLVLPYFELLLPNDSPVMKRNLRSSYSQAWSGLLSQSQITEALQLAPLLNIFAHLYGRGDWLTTSQRKSQHFQRYARSLTRRMHRETHDLQLARCAFS